MTGRELWDKLARGEASEIDFDQSTCEKIETADLG